MKVPPSTTGVGHFGCRLVGTLCCRATELANAAIDKTAEFFASIGIPQRLSEVGVDDSHFEAMADHIPTCWWPLSGALRPIDKADVIEILRASL